MVLRLRPRDAGRGRRRDAEPRDGPRTERLAEAARRHDLCLAAGSVPELGDDGHVYDTALVFNPQGELVAWHRKAHLYPPTLEHSVFTPGDRLTTFEDPTLGRVGLVVGFDGDFPEVARALALRGARLVLAPSAYEVEGATAWDLLHPALALTNSQWWVQANQAGSHSTSTLLGASRIIAPTGTVVAEASGAVPGRASPAELLVHRIDLHLAYQREGVRAPRGRAPARALPELSTGSRLRGSPGSIRVRRLRWGRWSPARCRPGPARAAPSNGWRRSASSRPRRGR